MEIKSKLNEIGLTPDNAIVIGSGVLNALKIRESNDIDVIVTPEKYQNLAIDSRFKKEMKRGREILTNDLLEIMTSWTVLSEIWTFDNLLEHSAVIDGVRYNTVQFLLNAKRSWLADEDVRQKDIDDVKLMQDYLNKIKEYQYWAVYVHGNQSYLGRCVIACKRAEADDLANATQEEVLEFLRIIGQLKNALQKAFQADWFNYSFLGNEWRHLHCHFVPRYQTERVFEGVVFKDELWGHNYKTNHNFQTPDEIREKIKQTIQKLIEGRPPKNWEPSLGRSALY